MSIVSSLPLVRSCGIWVENCGYEVICHRFIKRNFHVPEDAEIRLHLSTRRLKESVLVVHIANDP